MTAKHAVAEDIYVGLGYNSTIDLLDPWHENGSIERYDYIAGRSTGTGLTDYNSDATTTIIGYREAFYQELSIEGRTTRYHFISDKDSSLITFRHLQLVALAHAPQKYFRPLQLNRVSYQLYAGGGIGSIRDTTGNINRPYNYDAQTILVGVNFIVGTTSFARSPHRFFIEYSYVSADAKKREVMVQDGTMRQVGSKFLTRNIMLGYSVDIF